MTDKRTAALLAIARGDIPKHLLPGAQKARETDDAYAVRFGNALISWMQATARDALEGATEPKPGPAR